MKTYIIRTKTDNKLHAIQALTHYLALCNLYHKGYSTRKTKLLTIYK